MSIHFYLLKHRDINSKIKQPWTARDAKSTQLTNQEKLGSLSGLPKLLGMSILYATLTVKSYNSHW